MSDASDTTETPRDEDLSYERARDELTNVVRQLESGGLTLEQTMQLWERGERLATTCESWLEGARARLAAALAEQEPEADGPDNGNGTDDRPF
ncbi:exodeoxyribonuclease VII small subunit [Spiractinospora alimapuensis]|uniref:exodeoxyribonuclease VII small subunit n=1 Tax=Spiractinospora alimapuensis TaxID=2820884 RepID=UPI001EEC5B09|nr:exodeoxyribonuclease VII small subunit [Spiractinospora alimapuensis]QVQ51464.1 exodeoxyribonuclease VII small subunit [Spiractinospora alimapuensis]